MIKERKKKTIFFHIVLLTVCVETVSVRVCSSHSKDLVSRQFISGV
jgi:hypothetical protein